MSDYTSEPIAIVGSACRFAGGANSPSTLWDILEETPDLLKKIDPSRFNSEGFYHENAAHHGHTNVRHAYLLNEDVAEFDAEFFGVKPVEAKAMDPQQRFLLEVTYEAIEAAGITNLRGSNTGVYVGVMFNDYATMLLRDHQTIPTYFATGTGQSVLSNRISYFYDWHGPSVTIDTACSSSLVATHMAVQSLRSGECRVALACGSNLLIGPEPFIIESKLNMLSPDGRSRMWDQAANGYARGDGVAAIVLKTLSAALEDGDHIESIIRETGVNQDGATAGITMPSASAQVSLIRSTYAKAGLDLLSHCDRPQYFEAHGTGTPAGDPIEAEAIHTAFFTSDSGDVFPESTTIDSRHPLYVGSIKTILGHTEGAAGVAGLIKASLAVQRGTIPPNRLFNKLNPNVAPFYDKLEILRTKKLWPTVGKGEVRRASVNSFGFGGTNAHAIVESYETPLPAKSLSSASLLDSEPSQKPLFTPFVFSAFSEFSLRGMLSSYLHYLEGDVSNVQPRDLSWTLRQRRSEFQYRASFAASSLDGLRELIKSKVDERESNADHIVGIKSLPAGTRQSKKMGGILGIFTGQGAQHARMGASLIEESPAARKIIQELEGYLTQIPEQDRPSWSLKEELLAHSPSSRVQEAEISQPLCTALQILLVDLLRLAGMHFSAVVGHSSGEIAAAYAAGYLSARDAMLIAHYRGRLASLAANPKKPDIQGAMMAVGSSMEDLDSLCADERFAGRVVVAASNSASSVTISGDEDAITELEDVLIDEDKFNRRLKVDKAYHSHHMLPCYEPYVDALRGLHIKPVMPPSAEDCVWFSSVDGGRVVDQGQRLQELASVYWAENFTKPVLFSQALTTALEYSSFSLVLEVGPHPALKGPATETIREVLDNDIPYQGVLSRKQNATQALSETLGFLWSYLGKSVIDLDGFERAMGEDMRHSFRLVKSLPAYQWGHKTRYWHEARSSRKMRMRAAPVHPLLGDETPDSAAHHMRWRNLLRVRELEWLSGHAVQGQIVFPAAGYLATAINAAQIVAGKSTMCLIEMFDFSIHQAIPFEQDDAGIEVLIEMSDIARDKHDSNLIRAKFTYAAAIDVGSDNLTLAASSNVEIRLGKASASLLPHRSAEPPHMIEVEPERFYTALDELGYNFAGHFKSLTSMKRKRGWATSLVQTQIPDSSFLIHPATLDAVLQSAFLAYSYPYDQELRTLHLPTTIRRIRINPAALQDGFSGQTGEECFALVDASIDFGRFGQKTAHDIVANINFYASSQTGKALHTAVQVQGVSFLPLGSSADGEEYRLVYSKEHWVPCEPDGISAAHGLWEDAEIRQKARTLERIATFYLRKFHRDLPEDHPARTTFPTNWYLNHARHVSDVVESGRHAWWEPQWDQDTVEIISNICDAHMDLPDFQIMQLVGTQMPNVFEGKTTMLQQFRHDGSDILDRYYAEGTITKHLAAWVARVVKQIVVRHPHLRILEVGAGTGGATKAILNEIGDSFSSYTYTDISSAFFETASEVFSKYKKKMTFRALDIETDPTLQGFKEGAYDLVIAFFVVHATGDLERSLRNMRKLIRPGGFLAMGEGADNGAGTATSGFIFGTLPGWWVGTSRGRVLSPLVSINEWDGLLRSSGFSGIESATFDFAEDIFSVFPVVSQAIDSRVSFLRDPLSSETSLGLAGVTPMKRLILVGGQKACSLRLIDGLESLLTNGYATEMHRFSCIEDVDYSLADDDSIVVSLTDLDSPNFKNITVQRFEALKQMFEFGKTALWVTSGRRTTEPFANMMVAFARCAVHETSGLHVQRLDVSKPEEMSPKYLAEVLLRLHASLTLEKEKRTGEDIFWTVEPEMVMDDRGCLLVPRLNFITELNDRYNAGRRPTKLQPTSTHVIPAFRLQHQPRPGSSGNYILRELTRYETELLDAALPLNSSLEIRVLYSTISAIKTSFGRKLFIVAGVEVRTEHRYIALTSSRSSIIKIPHSQAVRTNMQGLSLKQTLSSVVAHIIALTAFNGLSSGAMLLAHNVPLPIVDALATQSREKKVEVVYSTDRTDTPLPDSWIALPKYLGLSDIKDLLVLDESPAAFLGLGHYETARSDNESTIILGLEATGATILTAKTLLSPTADTASNNPQDSSMAETIHAALVHAKKQWSAEFQTANESSSSSLPIVALEDILEAPIYPLNPLSIVDWTAQVSTLPILATRLDASHMFKDDSTYWIVGMSGALGISLADWMISRGVRNLVMTSRNPNIDPEWISAHKRRKSNVTIMACDVTDEGALKATHRRICETLPNIRGVVHGAMVLRDVAISNMSYEQFTDVIRPKVNGSIYLDRIFSENSLDFLVFTSSINTVIGNKGQANYAAANAFMCSLAAQRQKRGLRTAAVNGGAIIGAGYMERDSRRTWDRITQNNWMMQMSEDDFVQSVCEGIEACRLNSHGPEITAGLSLVPAYATNAPFWLSDPKFSFFITDELESEHQNQDGTEAVSHLTSVQDLLHLCKTEQECFEVIKNGFANMLRNVLQVTFSDDDLMASHSSDIGLDSLVSVNIRSWFLKQMQVGVPVLKIMSNETMADLLQFAISAMPRELVPQLHGQPESAETTAKASQQQQHLSRESLDPTIPQTNGHDNSNLNGQNNGHADGDVLAATPVTCGQPSWHSQQQMNGVTAPNKDILLNWEIESRPPTSMIGVPPSSASLKPVVPPRIVVLTGAGGLFGRHLVKYLSKQPSVQKVICIALRNLARRVDTGELHPPSEAIEYYEGDLRSPLLGLTPAQATAIFSIADAVIHNGADTSHLKRYQDLWASNVGSTMELVKICLPRRVPLHYVSSAGLALLYDQAAFPPVSVMGSGCGLPAADGSFGYASAKWTCEALLERTHALYSGEWPVCIHRPSTIIREGVDAEGRKAELDWVNALLFYAAKTKSVPRIQRNLGALDLVSVGNACSELVSRVMQLDERMSKGQISFAHQVGDRIIPLDRLQDLGLEQPGGDPFRVVPLDQWIAEAEAEGLHPAVSALVEMLDGPDLPDYPRLLKEMA